MALACDEVIRTLEGAHCIFSKKETRSVPHGPIKCTHGLRVHLTDVQNASTNEFWSFEINSIFSARFHHRTARVRSRELVLKG